jgi:Ni,Fe-hydrogenase maturation factor
MRRKPAFLLFFGNSLVEEDAMAKKIADKINLPNTVVVKCNSPEEILFYQDQDVVLIDVAINIQRVMLIPSLDMLKTPNVVSLHDFDLAFFLKLMERLQMVNTHVQKIPLIAVPAKGELNALVKDVEKQISSLAYGKIFPLTD